MLVTALSKDVFFLDFGVRFAKVVSSILSPKIFKREHVQRFYTVYQPVIGECSCEIYRLAGLAQKQIRQHKYTHSFARFI